MQYTLRPMLPNKRYVMSFKARNNNICTMSNFIFQKKSSIQVMRFCSSAHNLRHQEHANIQCVD
jgi:hypothetical protein